MKKIDKNINHVVDLNAPLSLDLRIKEDIKKGLLNGSYGLMIISSRKNITRHIVMVNHGRYTWCLFDGYSNNIHENIRDILEYDKKYYYEKIYHSITNVAY